MSLINSILGQKVILLLVGGTLLIFLVAVGLNFVVAIRAAAKRRAKRKAAEQTRKLAIKKARARAKAAQLAALEANRELPETHEPTHEPTLADELGEAAVLVVSDDAQAVVGEALTPPSVTMQGPTANAPVAPQILPTMQPASVGTTTPDQPKKETDKASEIQAMLADVFDDEESNERYDLLLGDTESIQVDDLLAQINRIAKQLGTGDASNDEVDRKESKAS